MKRASGRELLKPVWSSVPELLGIWIVLWLFQDEISFKFIQTKPGRTQVSRIAPPVVVNLQGLESVTGAPCQTVVVSSARPFNAEYQVPQVHTACPVSCLPGSYQNSHTRWSMSRRVISCSWKGGKESLCLFVCLVCVYVCVCTTLRKCQGKEHMNREKGQTQ